jgi:hypothetical protein
MSTSNELDLIMTAERSELIAQERQEAWRVILYAGFGLGSVLLVTISDIYATPVTALMFANALFGLGGVSASILLVVFYPKSWTWLCKLVALFIITGIGAGSFHYQQSDIDFTPEKNDRQETTSTQQQVLDMCLDALSDLETPSGS